MLIFAYFKLVSNIEVIPYWRKCIKFFKKAFLETDASLDESDFSSKPCL